MWVEGGGEGRWWGVRQVVGCETGGRVSGGAGG